MIAIEKDIPPPESNYGVVSATLRAMEVGDSFWCEAKKISSIRAMISRGYGGDRVFSTRKVDDGFRIWRIA